MKQCPKCQKIYSNKFETCECNTILQKIDNINNIKLDISNKIKEVNSMKTCPKCGGVYSDSDFTCSNCKVSLVNKSVKDNQVHCPKCNSTQIHSDRRGWKITTGLIGSSKTMCTCLKCGKQWKAGSI